MKRLCVLLAALLAALTATVAAFAGTGTTTATATAATDGVKLTEASVSSFPNKAYVISLPKAAKLRLGQLHVTENGQPVTSLRLATPGAQGGSNFGTILLLDTSNSMRGEPIASAMTAARAFAARRNPGQQLAVMTFDNNVETVLPFTTDEATIRAALAKTPRLQEGTHIHDGLTEAASLLRASGVSVGSIVILSDGTDVGSTNSLDSAIQSLKDVKARVFSVGLQSSQFDPDALETVATETNGSYAEASTTGSLAGIYDALGYKLGNEYLLRYQSLAGPDEPIKLAVAIKGLDDTATASYTTPALPSGSGGAVKSQYDKIVQSSTTLAFVIAMLVALVGVGVYALLYRRDRNLQKRLSEFVSVGVDEQARERQAEVKALLKDKEEPRSGLWGKLVRDVEFARIETPPATIAFITVFGGLVLGVIVSIIFGSPLGLFAVLIAPFITNTIIQRRIASVRKTFADQLPENLDILSSALRAGHSFVSGLSVVSDDAREPSKSEFRRVVADEQLGVPLDEALQVTAQRMNNRDILQVALIAQLQRDAGTNSAEVLEQVAINVRGRLELRRLIRTLTAQGRLARWIVSLLPVVLFFLLAALNRGYMRPLWDNPLGIAALIMSGFMIMLGSYIIGRIVDIEV
jgi:tight adherence protein B